MVATDTILRAHERAQRRFRRMLDQRTYGDPTSRTTRLYVQAERLIDRLEGSTPYPLVLTTAAIDARLDAAHEAYVAAMEELAEAEAQDARPWTLPDVPLAEGDARAMWGNR